MADISSDPRQDIVGEIERRRDDLNQRLVRVFDLYRVFIGLTLMIVSTQTMFVTPLGSLEESMFWWAAFAYCLFNVSLLLGTELLPDRFSLHKSPMQLLLILLDLGWLVLLMYASGGIASGLGALVLISVSAGAILVESRLTGFIAAVATLAVLGVELYLGANHTNDMFQAGVYGAMYFAAALLIQRLSDRVRENDILNLTQEAELHDLERLNRLILQRMRTGIVVVDEDDKVRLINQSARVLMGAGGGHLDVLPQMLAEKLARWRQDTSLRTPPFKPAMEASEIRVNFSAVRVDNPKGDVTLFIEDTAEVAQQAQQLKLAELGRLSASIAHEVRNPLGAISHAAQLLNESEALEAPDQRLADIIVSHCARMNDVVQNVLEMSRRRPPDPQRMSLLDCVRQFHEETREAFIDADIQIDISDQDAQIRIDQAHLRQVLTNLVDNGLRYSADQGHGRVVRLEGGVEAGSQRAYLHVIDFGSGVNPDLIPTLFQPFKTDSVNGTGLGLYIAKELCDANQAQLSYFPHTEGGSCFRILFAHPDRITL